MHKLFGLVTAVGLSVGLACSALAGDLMAPTYENTVVVAYPGGAELRIHYNEDGTFTMTTPEGEVSGTWRINDDGHLCQTDGSGEEQCTAGPIEERSVGDSWEEPDNEGTTTTISIVAGR